MTEEVEDESDYLVIGGGIAGVSCAEMLYLLEPEKKITLITATSFVKSVSQVNQITKLITEFQVAEQNVEEWHKSHQTVKVIKGKLEKVNPVEKSVILDDKRCLKYDKLCLCTGAEPNIISDNPNVIGIRDTASVLQLQQKLKSASKVIVIGNGGIATELIHELDNIDIVWAVKDDAISSVFLDPGASQFLLKQVGKEKECEELACKRSKYTIDTKLLSHEDILGSALGPDWHQSLQSFGCGNTKTVDIKYNVHPQTILSKEEIDVNKYKDVGCYPVYVKFSDDTLIGADFVISATGVKPSGQDFRDILEVSEEGAIKVNDNMQTSDNNIYAAGDICQAQWSWSKHWIQMRLWTQARQMGMFAAKCMYYYNIQEPIDLDFCFEMFTHVTKFFAQKVVLLGLFKGQGLDKDCNLLVRVTPGKEYVKVVMQNGRMQGAVLIGETDLEETFENLILNQMDLSDYGEHLLDPDVDIEDYFD